MFEKTIKSTRIYKGRRLGLRDDEVELSNGKISHREICEHPGAVAIVPITNDGKIILIRQFRKPIEEAIYEIPAGLINKGEELKDAAARELEEETGYKANKIEFALTVYTSPGYSTEKLHIFIARDLVATKNNPDEDENIEVAITPIETALQMIKNGEIKDGKTIVGINLTRK